MAWNSYLLYRFKVQFSSGYRYWAIFSDYPAYFGGSDAIYTKDGKTYYNSGVNAYDDGFWLKCSAHIFATNPNQTFYIAKSETNTENYTVQYSNGGMIQTGQYYVLSGDMYNIGYIDWTFERSYSGQYQITEIYSEYPDSCFNSNQAGFIAYITTGLQPPYNWQSVPRISGKNGILSLVTLDSESINDGEPVSGAAVSVFDQNPVSGNNVKDIVDGNTPLIPSAVDVTATFIISNPPVGELASRILAAKKDSIPESIEDADKTVSIPANASNVTMPGLDENSQYYFAIFVADATGDTAVSDPKDIYTSADEGWSFDYTGEIQTFTAPKTGIYQLETWGAQGGNASDGTLTARGGYGAYAYGEVLLQQGETLYINVGGQNGYGGGGNYVLELDEYLRNLDYSNYVYISGGQNKVTPFSGYEPNIQQYYGTNKILVVGKSENLRPVWDSENNCIRTNGTAGRYDYVFVAIPLPHRLYGVTKYTALSKLDQNGNTYGSIGVGCIINNSMRQTKGGNSFANDWAALELDGDSGITSDVGYTYYHLEDMPYIDYLTFELSQGMLYWKDNKLYFD